jgi:hypothetical protein
VNTPAPRPALKKAADAHIHPAAPGHPTHVLGHPSDQGVAGSPALPQPRSDPDSSAPAADQKEAEQKAADPTTGSPKAGTGTTGRGTALHRLSGPPSGTTSDSLRAGSKSGRSRGRGRPAEKTVEITFKVPKSVRKEFLAAIKADKRNPDEVATALLRAWLHG